jgi:hypothetical protein
MTPVNESECGLHIRSAPESLISSLGAIASRVHVDRAVLTRCLTHQVIDWYARVLNLEEISQQFESIYEQVRVGGKPYSWLRKRMDQVSSFAFQSVENVDVQISTIRWGVGRLHLLGRPIHAGANSLLLVGLARSITTLENKDWDSHNIEDYYLPEVECMLDIVSDLSIDVDSWRAKYDRRTEGIKNGKNEI